MCAWLRATFVSALVSVCGFAATFGTVVPARGHLADIALDPQRNVLYAANFTANRIEVLSLDNFAFGAPIQVSAQPSAVAVTADGQYLAVGHYNCPPATISTALTIVNLGDRSHHELSMGTDCVLAVAFGNGPLGLVVTKTGIYFLDPSGPGFTPAQLMSFDSKPLPVPWATYPAGIISGTAGVSADGNAVFALVDNGASSTLIRYTINDGSVVMVSQTSSPELGPRVLSVDQTGANALTGWALLDVSTSTPHIASQFPYPSGKLDQGSHAWDVARNLIYAQLVPGSDQIAGVGAQPGSPGFLQIFDADNLTVRETLQIRENLAGRSLLKGTNMYSISDSGITIFPIGALGSINRVEAIQADLFFQASGCTRGILTQQLDIVDPGANRTDFTLSADSPGVTFSTTAGTTPASVTVFVDLAAFQGQKGTAVVNVKITSNSAVNIPPAVRVLVNTRDPDQQGAIVDVPGTIVDVVQDPNRNRFYVLRQDRNQVLVFDGTTFSHLATLRTGNTPVQMAISRDRLFVTNDNSQYVSAFDLATLTPAAGPRYYMPGGYYTRSIAAANGVVLLTTRSTVGENRVASLDFDTHQISVAKGLTFIYINAIDVNSALAASPTGQTILMTMPDGTLAIYDTSSQLFVASRKDVSSLSGAYLPVSESTYIVGGNVFNTALVPSGQLDLLGGTLAGVAIVDTYDPLITVTLPGGGNGAIVRLSRDSLGAMSPVLISESPDTPALIKKTPLGQVGQTILPFTRTLAPLTNGNSIIQLSTSGFIVIPATFDAAIPAPPVIKAVTNAADLTSGISPGGLITIWGNSMATEVAAATALPLANDLGNLCLYAANVPVPLLYVSPNQINAQLPFETPSGATMVLTNGNGTSAPFPISVLPAAPALFRTADGTPIIIRSVDGKMITDATPIHLNQILTIYLTGLGAVSPGVTSGAGAPYAPLAVTPTPPAVYIGGTQLFTLWSGLVPGFVGLYQINAQVPFHGVPTGSKIPFTVKMGNVQTQVTLKVEQ